MSVYRRHMAVAWARLIPALLAIAACTSGELQAAAAQADPLEDLSFAALEKRAALNALRKEANPDRAQWPKADVPGLDFMKTTGNAIIVHHESGQRANPFATLTTSRAPFPTIIYLDSKE